MHQKRYIGLDITRGIAVLLMILYHIYFDVCNFFGFQTLKSIDIIGNLGAVVFILIAGYAFSLALQKYKQDIFKKYFLYSIQLFVFAVCISLLTAIFSPENTVWFGVLHFFSLAFLGLLLTYRLKNIYLLGIISVFFLGAFMFGGTYSQSKILFLLGLSSGYASGDYYPLFPYFGYILIGYMFGTQAKFLQFFEKNPFGNIGNIVALIGKKSLLIYIIHQPIIIGSLLILKNFMK